MDFVAHRDFEDALIAPEDFFSTPMSVLETEALTADQQMKILKRWKLTATELDVAQDENMSGGEHSQLDTVNSAITVLSEQSGLEEDDVD